MITDRNPTGLQTPLTQALWAKLVPSAVLPFSVALLMLGVLGFARPSAWSA